jgi:hypothetical protein
MNISIEGKSYRLLVVPAVSARAFLEAELANGMACLHRFIEAQVGGVWTPLDTKEKVETLVDSWEILAELEVRAYEFNYGFLKTWKPASVPAGMLAKHRVLDSKNVDPVIAAVIMSGLATYQELRDEYSLEEAFKILDVVTVSKINDYRAMEAAK